MSETSAARSQRRSSGVRRADGNPLSRLVRRASLFWRQILGELRKVVRPTGSELLNYTVVVIFFVLVIMAIVSGLDLLFQRLVLLVFAG